MASPPLKRKRHRITAPLSQQPQHKNSSTKVFPSPQYSTDIFQNIKLLIRRLAHGLVGALHACAILTLLMVVSAVLGFGTIMMWAEEPVFVKEKIYFDYAEKIPVAVMRFRETVDGWEMDTIEGVPVGHSFWVELVLFLPESDFNCEIGVFQVVADLTSTNGNVVARMSQPCMLKFRSLPVRLMRTFLMSAPLLMGLTSETQKLTIPILKYKEKAYPRTEAIKVTLIPRSGTNFIPQIYEAEIILNSKLPWKKEILSRWKWTFCIWTSLYIYTFLLVIFLCWFRRVIFPSSVEVERDEEREKADEEDVEEKEDGEVSEMLRRWRRRRSKKKAMLSKVGAISETVGPSSAWSMSVTWEESHSNSVELGVENSESVCFREG